MSSVVCPAKLFCEPIEEDGLALEDLLPRDRYAEPFRPVDFGKGLTTTRSWRPLQFERVAFKLGGVPVVLDSPDVNNLAPRLSCSSKLDSAALRSVAGLFDQLTPRR